VANAFRPLTHKPLEYDRFCLNCYLGFQHSPGYAHALLSYVRSAINLLSLTGKGRKYRDWFNERLPGLELPVLGVWGKQDRIISSGNAASLMKLLQRGEFREVDKCEHCPHFEYPEDFNRRASGLLETTVGASTQT